VTVGRLLNRQFALAVGTLGVASSRPDAAGVHPTLQIAFSVEKGTDPSPNGCELSIYNLSKDSRAKVETAQQPVALSVGYGSTLFRLFTGDVQYASSTRQGADWVTTVHLQDGANGYRNSRINISLAAGTTLADAIRQTGDAFGLPVGNLLEHLKNIRGGPEVFNRGVVLSGKTNEQFGKLMRMAGYGWSIQDGQLQVLGPDEPMPGTAVLLTPNTGLIGSPERGDKGVVKVRALLQPYLFPGNPVRVEGLQTTGLFRVEKGKYVGNMQGPEWYAELELKPL
jgi:hypothetical protein